MSDIIHLLPDHLANQIAAGEVIQRPASVVKELMENSIDAGAGHITVNIKDAGRTLIQVVDDGKGMTEMDARMAFERHATSKISSVEDLFSLRTMGFRGEALASIAAVAQVELCTRTKDDDMGTRLSVSGSVVESAMPDACGAGSIFSVKNLFYNVPARRKFLKSNEVEFRHILTEFERVALVHPDISCVLRHQDLVVFNLPASGLKQRILDTFGKNLNQRLLSLEVNTSIVKIRGFVGRIDMAGKRSLQYFFTNGRYMRHPYFHKAVLQAYEQMIQPGDMPDYFIYLEVDPSDVDVNIHPTKTEIKFENEHPIRQIIFSAIRETLAKANAVPSINFDTTGNLEIPVYNPTQEHVSRLKKPEIDVDNNYNPFREAAGGQPIHHWETLYEGFEKGKTSAMIPEGAFSELSRHAEVFFESASNRDSTTIGHIENPSETALFTHISHPCFQYKNRYIITPLKSGLLIIEQHRAHVRILYERYMGCIHNGHAASQKLLFPEMVDFTAEETSLLPSLSAEIKSFGFDFEPIDGNSYTIHAVPADATGKNPLMLIKNMVSAAIEYGKPESKLTNEKMALSLAKTTAIPAGKILVTEEMEAIVAALFAIEANGITPDGLPVLTLLTDDELVKRLS